MPLKQKGLLMSSVTLPSNPVPAGYPTGQYLNLQQNLPPLAQKRLLTHEETALLKKGTEQWTGKWFPHMGTELWELMSNPLKQASLWGHVTGLFTGVASAASLSLGQTHLGSLPSGLAGLATGLAIGLPVAWLSKAGAEQRNGNLKDIWQRLPIKPTYRDFLSDGVASARAPVQVANAGQIASGLLATTAKIAIAGALGNARPAIRRNNTVLDALVKNSSFA
jgi:hypothetical protein